MATFILVHGAFHGAWCWERLVPLLEARGHAALAIDLPGMGADSANASTGTLAGYAAHVAALAREQAEKPILVGHSLGGATVTQAGELAAEDLAGLVYLTAVLLPAGATIAEMADRGLTGNVDPPMRMSTEGAPEGCVIVPAEDVVAFMYHRTDPEGRARAIASVTPQAVEPMTVPMATTPARWGRLPRAYVECADDRILTIAAQRAAQRALPCDPVMTIDSDHSPFFSATEQLTDALEAIAEAWQA